MSDPVSFPDKKLLNLLGKLWIHISRSRRAQLVAAVLMMLLSSLAEVVSLAAVILLCRSVRSFMEAPLVQTWVLPGISEPRVVATDHCF